MCYIYFMCVSVKKDFCQIESDAHRQQYICRIEVLLFNIVFELQPNTAEPVIVMVSKYRRVGNYFAQ